MVGGGYFDSDVPGQSLITSEPNSRVTAVTKLVHDQVSVLESAANLNRMVATWPIVVESFHVVDVLIHGAVG